MKLFITLFLLIFAVIFHSCDITENSTQPLENSGMDFSSKRLPTDYTEPSLQITKEIDGLLGGEILFESSFVDNEGNTVLIHTLLTFEPNSFQGIKEITVKPDPETGSILFSPEMKFNIPAKLDLLFSGINLAKLGFNSNSKADFVYMSDNGDIQYILKNECKIKWNTQELFVKKAELPHFSRYVFIRKG